MLYNIGKKEVRRKTDVYGKKRKAEQTLNGSTQANSFTTNRLPPTCGRVCHVSADALIAFPWRDFGVFPNPKCTIFRKFTSRDGLISAIERYLHFHKKHYQQRLKCLCFFAVCLTGWLLAAGGFISNLNAVKKTCSFSVRVLTKRDV